MAPPLLLPTVLVEQAGAGKRHRNRPEGADKLPFPVAVAIALGRTVALIALAAAERRFCFLLDHRLDEGTDAKADRLLQRIKPIFTGEWNGGRRCCKMVHGVSSFRRLHTAFLNVLQSGAYADSPIFHQPYDTTRQDRCVFWRSQLDCQRRSKSTPLAGVKKHHLMRFSPPGQPWAGLSGFWGFPPFLALVETVAVAVHLQDMNVVCEPVQQRPSQALGTEHLGPLIER